MELTICPSKLLYKIPCPGCGVTRATLLFIEGHIKQALLLNPNCLFAVIFIYLYPIIALYSLLYKQSYIAYLYNITNNALKNKIILFIVIFFETAIWLHNIIIDT